MPRQAKLARKTSETSVELTLGLDGVGRRSIATGVGFFDHMLDLFAAHGRFDLSVQAEGDRHVDDHHTVEDVGIALGRAFDQALGERAGIVRYGHVVLPMDESLATVAVDFSGRPALVFDVPFPTSKIGTFDTELAAEFWQAMALNARMSFHAVLHHGRNSHHICEAVFKAAGRALRQATSIDRDAPDGVPSTKGVL